MKAQASVAMCVVILVMAEYAIASEMAPAAEALGPAKRKALELEAKLEAAKARLEQSQAEIAALENELSQAKRTVIEEIIQRCSSGDESAFMEVLEKMKTAGHFVEYSYGRAFKGMAVNGALAVKLIRREFPQAADTYKCKLCWLLGINGSPEAAAYLREILSGDEKSGDVVSNALAALRRVPRSAGDEGLVKRYTGDQRELKINIDFYQAGYKPPPTVGWYATDFARDFNTENRATIPGKIVVEAPTFICLGLEWHIEGDTNLNCTVNVAYRKKGIEGWKSGFPFLRCDPRPHPVYPVTPGNLLAGSIFDLQPDTDYEIKLSLYDPDGGKDEQIVTARTRTEPRAYEDGRKLYVIPGNGGGTGTKEDPLKGLEEADKAAQPGDIFLLQEGVYRGGRLKKSGEPGKPIVYRGVDAEKVTIDKALEKVKSDEVLNFIGLKNIHFEKIGFKGGTIALRAEATEDIVIRRCKIFAYKTVGIRGSITSLVKGQPPVAARNLYIADNLIQGPANWVKGRSSDSFGMSITGAGHVICYNRIENNWDNISLAGGGKDPAILPHTVSNDIYGNDLIQATDDGIEADYTMHNTRIFRNRLNSTFSSMSFQPIFGGPGYMLYNAMYNTTNKPFKLHVDPTGVIIAHNTCVAPVEAFYGGGFHNALFRNNLLLGRGRERSGYWLATSATGMDMDYTGFNLNNPDRLIKFNNVVYQDMASFNEATGIGKHNVQVDWNIFANLVPPPGPGKTTATSKVDLTLRAGSAAVDAGAVMPGINDGFSGKAPDLGCYELGAPVPHYGPRPE